jgi:2-polyprenyl-3-methyl-5-hydroxy-6-metoxy-1,4-benzoquinol methylase
MKIDRDYGYSDAKLTPAHGYLLPTIRSLMTDLSRSAKVLDLGCGNGSLTAALSSPGWRMYGVDASESGIWIAKEQYPTITFQCGVIDATLASTLGANSFDAIVCAEVVEHIYYPRDLAKCAYDLLRPGGRLVITTPYHGYLKNLALAVSGKMDQHWTALWDGGHIKFWSWKTLSNLLQEAGFTDFRFHGSGRLPFLWKSMVISCNKPL